MFAIWDEKVILKKLNPPSLPPIFLGWDRCHKSPPKIAKSGHCRILRKALFHTFGGIRKPLFLTFGGIRKPLLSGQKCRLRPIFP